MVFANYLQNYDLINPNTKEYLNVDFSITLKDDVDHSIDGPFYEPNALNLSQAIPGMYTTGATISNQPKNPMKSLKSMRTYQLGVVYRDRYVEKHLC